jgi:hypothetical protein
MVVLSIEIIAPSETHQAQFASHFFIGIGTRLFGAIKVAVGDNQPFLAVLADDYIRVQRFYCVNHCDAPDKYVR